jgi:hypothetical protein
VNHSSTNHIPVTTLKDKSVSSPAAATHLNHSSSSGNNNNSTISQGNSSSSNTSNQNHNPGSNPHNSHALPVPLLDGDMMNRVIVDALSNGPNPSPSTYTNGMFDTGKSQNRTAADQSSSSSEQPAGRGRSSPPGPHSPAADVSGHGVANGSGGIKSESVASLTAASLLNAESQLPIGSATKAIASAKSAASASAASTAIAVSAAVSGIVSVTTSSSAPPATPPEDKPLNLSSSKVLHASNQQIIDHFIDKLLTSSECAEGQYHSRVIIVSSGSQCHLFYQKPVSHLFGLYLRLLCFVAGKGIPF